MSSSNFCNHFCGCNRCGESGCLSESCKLQVWQNSITSDADALYDEVMAEMMAYCNEIHDSSKYRYTCNCYDENSDLLNRFRGAIISATKGGGFRGVR